MSQVKRLLSLQASSLLALRYLEVPGLASSSGHGEETFEHEICVHPHFVLPVTKAGCRGTHAMVFFNRHPVSLVGRAPVC